MLCGLDRAAIAQTGSDYDQKRQQAFDLFKQNKMNDAAAIFEQLVKQNDQDRDVLAALGFCLYSISSVTLDDAKREEISNRARTILLKAKDLGDNSRLSALALAGLSGGVPGAPKYSENKAANKAMQDAEISFVKGDMETAIQLYKMALSSDPNLYEAALYIGDSYYKSDGKLDMAGEWFAKAIAINPNRETAYRYWADALMKQGKPIEARDKYIEAYISEPYNQLAASAFVGYAKNHDITLSHPVVKIPTSVDQKGDGNTTITLDPDLMNRKDDGSSAWITYGIARTTWATKRFAEEYPNEKTYRHSLKEEADSLRMAIKTIDKKVRESDKLDPSLANLIKMDDAGVLEAYILLARADRGIAQDYPEYRKTNRDKLKKYVVEFVMKRSGISASR